MLAPDAQMSFLFVAKTGLSKLVTEIRTTAFFR